MGADTVYEMLHPFHVWAQISALCAFVLAIAAWALLTLASRGSRRWWLGLGFFALCLGTVAFGERSRMAASDMRSIAVCLAEQVPACENWRPWLTDAVDRVNILGPMAVVVAAFGLLATLATLYAERRTITRRIAGRPPTRALQLPLGVAVAGIGAFLMADGVAAWIAFAPLADIANAGDGLGQIPLIEAIIGTIFAAVVLGAGLALTLSAAFARNTPRQLELAG
jgi:hypothetical protein